MKRSPTVFAKGGTAMSRDGNEAVQSEVELILRTLSECDYLTPDAKLG